MQSADFHGAPIKCLRIRIHSQDSRSVVLLSRGATRSTMCRCNSLRHQNRDDSGHPRTRHRKRIDTTVVCIRARRLSSSIFTCSPLRVSNLQVFDLAIPRQPSGRATSSTWTLSERSSTPSVNDLLTSSSRSLTVLRKSERRTRPRRHIARLLANTAETAFDASTVPHRARTSRGARLLPVHGCSAPARPWGTVSDSDTSSPGTRFQRSLCHRFANRDRKRLGVCRRLLECEASVCSVLYHGQHRVSQILCVMQKPSLASAADSVLAEGIALNKFVTTVYGTGRGNGARHRATPSVFVRGVHRALEESFTPHSAALGDGCALDMWRTRQQQSSATAAQSASALYSKKTKLASEAWIASLACG
jgi:hypothetical protein